ncbi:DMT family transporter [Paenibacillus sp. YYML68]|uniref:DMT family transporter n=1 Tax=Paenibacillus sp. YYML68 TaxID=2909250 RepID=UPI00249155E9|nr:DMT family transporter [Paenibacillus sp. YYML68]
MNSSIKALVQLGVAMIIIGSFVPVNKVIVEHLPVFLASELRLVIGAVVLIPLLLLQQGRFQHVTKRDLGVLFIQAFIGVFVFSICMLQGVKLTSGVESGIMTSTTPVIVAIIAYFLFKERLSRVQLLGIVLAMLGTLSIQALGAAGGSARDSGALLGNLLVLAAIGCEAVFLTFGRLASKGIRPVFMSTMMSVYGAVLFLPWAWRDLQQVELAHIPLEVWGLVLYSGLVVTVGAIILLHRSTSHVDSNTIGVFSALMPVSAIWFSAIGLGESFTWTHALGTMLVLAGVGLLTVQFGRKTVAKTTAKTTAPAQAAVPAAPEG